MESDSDSDASHISATPPRESAPPPPPPPRLSSPRSRARVSLLSKHKLHPHPKPRSKSKPQPSKRPPPPPAEPEEAPFPAADLSTLPGFSVKIQPPPSSLPNRATSFSSLVKSRKPSFDPSDFQKDAALVKPPTEHQNEEVPYSDPHPSIPVPSRVRPSKAPLNFVLPDLLSEPSPKRQKHNNEGNFVRLNINGHGRKNAYRTGKNRPSTSYTAQRYRRRWVKSRNFDNGPAAGDGGCVQGEACEKSNCASELIEEAVRAAGDDPSEQNLRNLLKLTHGYDSFREGQVEAVKRVVAGESVMLLLPTGAGKSLCYQLAALILPGITLVVSPLVALMVDQLRHLPPIIPGGLLSSSQTIEEASTTLQRLREGHIKVLFVSPERFLNAEFLSIFGDTLSISLVVIDEAHCLSEWSHNFRPSYLRLRASVLRAKLNVECFLAMTATATRKTLHDIMTAVEIPPSNLIQTCQMRENLQFCMSLSENRLKDLLKLMKSSPFVEMKSIIVYCKFQAETDTVSKHLTDNNIPSKAYHSGVAAKYRSRIQEHFCSNKIRVIVATVAFGMGLDKSDVEAVIHYSMPESLEEYIQETGRAGRDGRLSFCHLLLDYTTYFRLRSLLYSDGVDEYVVSKLLYQIFSDDTPLAGNICVLVKDSAIRKFDMKEEVILTILTQLEMGDVQYLHLLPQFNVTCTLYFHKTPNLLSTRDILIETILKKSEVKQGYYVFDIPTVANFAGITTIGLLNQLRNLKFMGKVTYDLKDPAFCFNVVKKPDDFCSLTASLTKWLSEVESCKVRKIDAMFHVATFAIKECKRVDGCSNSMHTPCIQRKISDYFCGEHEFPNNCSGKASKSSPFLRADIKVFLQSNSHAKFTPRAVARIMHGIPSPAFPSLTWSKCHFWGRYIEVDFPLVMEAASVELLNFVKKGAV